MNSTAIQPDGQESPMTEEHAVNEICELAGFEKKPYKPLTPAPF